MQVGLAAEQVIIENNTFEQHVLIGSSKAFGGGINCIYCSQLSIAGNFFLENELHGEQVSGGGICVVESSDLTEIRGNSFNNNTGTGNGFGGGISLFDMIDIPVQIDKNYFEDNSMSKGGAIFSFNCFNTHITNNVISNNNASSEGGGIRFRYYPGKFNGSIVPASRYDRSTPESIIHDHRSVTHPVVMNNSFVGNTSGQGGAIYNDHEAEVPLIVNSIFWENEADMGDNIFNLSTDSLLLSHCNINDSANTHIYGRWKGNDNFHSDPGFIDDSCHIDEYSPCVDEGADSIEFAGNWYYAPDHDFDGTIRPYGEGLIDIGADECDIFTSASDEFKTQHSTFTIEVFPNPTRGIVDCQFSIVDFRFVSMKMFDLHGREVATVLDETLPAGEHVVRYDASHLPDGIYFVRLQAGEAVETGKLVLVH
jgi:hypothetical protein